MSRGAHRGDAAARAVAQGLPGVVGARGRGDVGALQLVEQPVHPGVGEVAAPHRGEVGGVRLAVALPLDLPKSFKFVLVIAQGAVSGFAVSTAIALMWEVLGRGVAESRRRNAKQRGPNFKDEFPQSGGSNGLHGKHERRAGRGLTHSARGSRAGLSRFDTDNASAQARNGMQAAFVAQVLGQVLETKPESPILAVRVYARSARNPKDGRLIRVL